MANLDLEGLKYPIGRFVRGTAATDAERQRACIAIVQRYPQELVEAVAGLTEAQLDIPYRPGGWTVRQVVHHVADSHSQCLQRFKLALTEDGPVIKPYREERWAEHVDARTMPLDASLGIVAGIHARWAVLLGSLSEADFSRTYFHPEQDRSIAMAEALELYVWHGAHHRAHIVRLRERMGW
ncbi:MAG: YfiT family bacillithiol transferase [Flavobacteriales bacterium]